ncbi:hypothetical protein D3C86_1123530 [compost metagenome]
MHGAQEGITVRGGDAVFDQDHDRATVMSDLARHLRLGPVPCRDEVFLALRQAQAVQQQRGHDQPGCRNQQRARRAGLLRHEAPQQAAACHRPVEHHLVDRQRTPTHPVRQNRLRHAAERGQRRDPRRAEQQQQRQGDPDRRCEGQHRHDPRRDERGEQHHPIGIEPALQPGHDQRAKDGAQAHAAQQHAVEAGAPVQQLLGDQRQQRPDAAAEREVDGGARQHHVQLAVGAREAQAGAEGAEEMLAQWVGGALGALPPDQRGNHEQVAEQVQPVGGGRAERGQQQAAGGGADGTRDVHAERVERHGALQLLHRHQFRHDGLPCWPHHGRADAAGKGHGDQDLDGQRLVPGEQHQRAADHRHAELDDDQEAAPVKDIGQHAGRNGQQEHRQRGGGLDRGDGSGG